MSRFSQILSRFFVSKRMRWTLWLMLLFCLLFLGLLKSYELYLDTTFPKDVIEARFAPLTSQYGIKIVYEVSESFFSELVNPIVSAGPKRNSTVTPIRNRVLLRYPKLLQTAFEKYPLGVIKDYLNAIHFAASIHDNGFLCAGSYDPFRKVIYLVDNGWVREDQALSTFHHEFSSLLLNGHSLVLNPWIDQNPKDFVYLYKTGQKHIEVFNKSSIDGNEEDYEKGFMNTYGQTNFENDFNEYSAMILTYPEKFKQIMNQYPRVRGKFLVWLKFYQEIDPIFTEEYLLGAKQNVSTLERGNARAAS
ncbi:MAG: hypothetical protein WAU91_04170 [Desulfatitalea sp.]